MCTASITHPHAHARAPPPTGHVFAVHYGASIKHPEVPIAGHLKGRVTTKTPFEMLVEEDASVRVGAASSGVVPWYTHCVPC